MRMFRLASALAWLTVLPVSALHATEAPSTLRAQLLAITQAWVDAIPLGRQDVWEHTLTHDAVLIDEFGRIQHKQDAVASLHPLPSGLSGSIELRDPHVQQYGDTALLQVEWYERESVFGQQLVVRYQSLLTFVKQDGAWKLAGAEDVTIPTAPPKLQVNGLVLGDYTGSYRYGPDRAWSVSVKDGVLGYVTRAGRPFNRIEPIARDVFMGTDDERNLLIFRRDAAGHVTELIERRKFNDLHLTRDTSSGKT
ncbi:nuclear transport factor 2 family protein [Rhodanobacter sp. C05]|uniref:nuclear transport factor 2 family protein n=1 Tax=Rhodanobacter sp. C05 TaxID=1945855 RepID=UPI00143876C5|nr:nuclear transport factor 2 family protein [Rhodanobacter sp. C05]